jgi:hypothetical protein
MRYRHHMPFAQASTVIDAPIDVVWRVMLDLAGYRAWNPFIVDVDTPGGREARVGDDITLHVQFRGARKLVASHERITRLEAPYVLEYQFRGPLHHMGLVRGRRLQTLHPESGSSTRYSTKENFVGLLAMAIPTKLVQDGFERHAQALKHHAEAIV